jgi:hypothetical protein
MATLASDLLKKDERAIVVATTLVAEAFEALDPLL